MDEIASSTTSCATSRRSSTSDATSARVGGFVQLVHPFPSVLDGVVTGAIALIAGGPVEVGARLGVAMFCLQAAIGTANDIVDAPADKDRKLGKPIPAGLVGVAGARAILGLALLVGLALSAVSGPAVLAVAVAGVSIGFAYDVRLKGTAWSWLPFALGIPLLPVYAWLGASGGLPEAFLILLPLGFLAGTALAHANALVDIERDRAAGTRTVATTLGRMATWRTGVVLQAIVVTIAIGTLVVVGGDAGALFGALAAAVLIGLGLALGLDDDPWRRARGWELQGVGIGLLAAAWLLGAVVSRAP